MDEPSRLHRALGVRGAVVVGLSAMLGTGVFAVWTPALALTGGWLLVSLVLAACVAALNAVSTARLAMAHPESGGAYAYGRIRLNRSAGVLAGGAFVIGKSASAAAAALTIGVYLWPGLERLTAWLAIAVALAIDLRGIVKSTRVSAVLVALVLGTLVVVIVVGAGRIAGAASALPLTDAGAIGVLAASGLLFVAFAGYARITVLGEEVRDPRRTIPRAMVWSFVVVTAVYAVLAVVVLQLAAGGTVFSAAPLADIVSGTPIAWIVTVGAVLGAGSVLISLLAGIGRTLFAMAARGDAPAALVGVSRRRVPHRAGIVAAVLAALLVTLGELSWALALSGASVLSYYAVAHLAAWTLPGRGRRWVPVLGLIGCVAILGALGAAALLGALPGR